MKNLKEILASQDRDTIQEIVYWTCIEHGLVATTAIPDFNSVEFDLSVSIKEVVQMTSNKYDYEKELKAAKRAEIERIWFNQEATNKELLDAYKALDIKEEEKCK